MSRLFLFRTLGFHQHPCASPPSGSPSFFCSQHLDYKILTSLKNYMSSFPATQYYMHLHNLAQRHGWSLERETYPLKPASNEEWVAAITGRAFTAKLSTHVCSVLTKMSHSEWSGFYRGSYRPKAASSRRGSLEGSSRDGSWSYNSEGLMR